MPLSYVLDVQQGVSSTASAQHNGVGHLVSANFFGSVLSADLTVTDPLTPGTSMLVVGVLSRVDWVETPSTPISMAVYVSAHNRAVIQPMVETTIKNTAVIVSFRVDEYDPARQVYFAAFAPQQQPPLLKAVIGSKGAAPDLQINSNPTIVNNIQLYETSFSIAPPPQSQNLTVAASASNAVVKPWGYTLGQST